MKMNESSIDSVRDVLRRDYEAVARVPLKIEFLGDIGPESRKWALEQVVACGFPSREVGSSVELDNKAKRTKNRSPKPGKNRASKQGKNPPSKPRKTKSVKPSTTRSTAGPGFDFEDRVAAWLLLKVLIGQPLPGTEGIGTRLQMQVEALGWAIDDILLTMMPSPTDQRHLAISCKSNVQVTASALPAGFVAAAGVRERGLTLTHFVMARMRGRNNTFMATWSELKDAAAGSDLSLALGRMHATAKHRTMFNSVGTPAKDADARDRGSDREGQRYSGRPDRRCGSAGGGLQRPAMP